MTEAKAEAKTNSWTGGLFAVLPAEGSGTSGIVDLSQSGVVTDIGTQKKHQLDFCVGA